MMARCGHCALQQHGGRHHHRHCNHYRCRHCGLDPQSRALQARGFGL